jgi:acetylornithine deacetylase
LVSISSIQVRVGFFPEVSIQSVKNEIEATLREAASHRNITYSIHYNGFHAEGCVMNKESEMMKKLSEIHTQVTKTPATYAHTHTRTR